MKKEKVAIIGASDRPDRFAYKAFKALTSHGHQVFLVSPNVESVEGQKVFKTIKDIPESLDTITMYVNPKISQGLKGDLVEAKPKRVIFNPGTENASLESALEEAGIKPQEDCTLVLLNSGRY